MDIGAYRAEDRIERILQRCSEVSRSLCIFTDEVTVARIVHDARKIVVTCKPEPKIGTIYSKYVLHCDKIRDSGKRHLLIDVTSCQ